MSALQIRRSTLASPEAARLIAALNSELLATFPEPGATHFSIGSVQVSIGDGAFLTLTSTMLRSAAAQFGASTVRQPS
jgi:hypothetical protein